MFTSNNLSSLQRGSRIYSRVSQSSHGTSLASWHMKSSFSSFSSAPTLELNTCFSSMIISTSNHEKEELRSDDADAETCCVAAKLCESQESSPPPESPLE